MREREIGMKINNNKIDVVFVDNDLQEDEDKDDLEDTVSGISLRLNWVSNVFFIDMLPHYRLLLFFTVQFGCKRVHVDS